MTFAFVKTEPVAEPIVVEGWFRALPETVFRAWTDPDSVVKWFGTEPNSLVSATIDLRPGGAWRFLGSEDATKSVGFEGEYLAVEPGRRLVFSWSHVVAHANGEREAMPFSRVEVTFTPKGAGTDVRLVHSAIESEGARRGVGWEASFASITALLEDRL